MNLRLLSAAMVTETEQIHTLRLQRGVKKDCDCFLFSGVRTNSYTIQYVCMYVSVA